MIVQAEHAPEALLRAAGVGERLRDNDANGTAAALAPIALHGDELLSAGVAPATLAEVKALGDALTGKHGAQGGAQTAKRTAGSTRPPPPGAAPSS